MTENTARITAAINSIKAAIIAKGVTPTGKCETFADAIAEIPNAQVKTGTFTSSTNGVTIDCGFIPKQISVCVNLGTTAYSQLDMYKEGTYSGARGASVNSGGTIGTAAITVSGNKFTHKAFNTNYVNKTSHYIALG